MPFKPRTILIIFVSSLIIASVLALTMFGFFAYLEWTKKHMRNEYKLALYELNGKLFNQYVIVDLYPKIGERGIFRNKSIIAGTIKNISEKGIYSLKLKIGFYNKDGKTIYVDTFYPTGLEFEPLRRMGDVTKNFLRKGDSISFKHELKKCPTQLLYYLKSKAKFAKSEKAGAITLKYTIEGLEIK